MEIHIFLCRNSGEMENMEKFKIVQIINVLITPQILCVCTVHADCMNT